MSEEFCPLQGGGQAVPAPCLSVRPACLLLKQAAPHGMLSECSYTERNRVLCSEESERTRAFSPSPLSCVWVLWVAMRRKMRHCTSHLGSVGAAEESALVSRFIRKTNKGKYSLKRYQKSQLRITGPSHLIPPVYPPLLPAPPHPTPA